MKKEIHDSDGKLVCIVDDEKKSVEIKKKAIVTTISFKPNGEVFVKERKAK